MTREEWRLIERKLQTDDDTRRTHEGRCEEQGHQWENCCSPTFRIYQQCKWCGAKR